MNLEETVQIMPNWTHWLFAMAIAIVKKRYRQKPYRRMDVCLSFQAGISVHEIGHVLGMWHEQQRSDRDNYVDVLYENLGFHSGQFVKFPTNSYGVPYDYSSVLHYSGKVHAQL